MNGEEYQRRCAALGDRGLDQGLVTRLQRVGVDEALLDDWEAMSDAAIAFTNGAWRMRQAQADMTREEKLAAMRAWIREHQGGADQ